MVSYYPVLFAHDVDWLKEDLGSEHVLARRDKSDDEVARKTLSEGFLLGRIPFIDDSPQT